MAYCITARLIHRILASANGHLQAAWGVNLLPWWLADRFHSLVRTRVRDRGLPGHFILTLGSPFLTGTPSASPARLYFSQRRTPTPTTLALFSSHLPRPWDRQSWWFERLGQSCRRAHREGKTLLGVSSSTTTRFLFACDAIHKTQSWILTLPSFRQSLHHWLDSLPLSADTILEADIRQSQLSPILSAASGKHASPGLPEADALMIELARDHEVLYLRPNGRLKRALPEKLSSPTPPVVSSCPTRPPIRYTGRQPAAFLVESSPLDWRDYLAHWTRDPDGPWPGESLDTWLGQLVRNSPLATRGPLLALRRIIRQRQITASHRTIRGGSQVVCFTAVPFNLWRERRVYRRHRRRWDFEPFAIAILKSWLVARGAQPVRYGHESEWQRLPAAERPFFQKAQTESGFSPMNWREEEEWRLVGHLDLSELPRDSAVLLAPDTSTATQLAYFSPWPVIAQDTDDRNRQARNG